MSRLIVKNLPTYITEPRLREHFSSTTANQPVELTDVRIVHKKDGSTRRIAFLGFKTEEQAQRARDYFDKSYLDISKLRVETVTGTKDAPIPVRGGKRAREPTDEGGSKERKRQKVEPSVPTGAKPSQLEEFHAVMGAKANGRPSWVADVETTVPAQPQKTKKVKEKTKAKKENVIEPENEEPVVQEGLSDMEWMRRKMQAGTLEEKAFEQSDDEMENADEPEPPVEPSTNPTHASILTNGRLFIRNLVFSCTEEELRQQFSSFGEIEQVHIPLDTSSNPKGFAYVRYKTPSDAVTAYDALDGSSFQGRLLHILPAVDKNPKPVDDQVGKPTRLKDTRAQKKKESSGKDFNWGVLYMNSDAVTNSIADRLGISKADIVNPDSSGVGGSAAVKLALAETHIIAETKKYFEQRNVDLALFSQTRAPRSRLIILVKNIPYGTSNNDITELFSGFGRVRRTLLPPAGTIAIVEFAEGQEKEASNAWKGLAYKRLKDSILYLEWAPLGLFDGTPAPVSTTSNAPTTNTEIVNKDHNTDDDDEPTTPPGATLYIGNLSFATTSERLASVFRHLESFSFARVATKVDPARPGKETLSQGFGFVGFRTVDGAQKALKGITAGAGLVLDGHVLRVSFAGRGKDDVVAAASGAGAGGGAGIAGKVGKSKGTKLIVKNLAFEVSKKELWELFSAHGQVKSVRLPNRADRRSRGFAFVDFATRKEAEHALEQLRHSHLLGRHLVLEWAEREMDVEAMRMKTAMEYGDGDEAGLPGHKEKLKLGLGGSVEEEEE